MIVFEGDLIVCGNFLKAGGVTVNGVGRWDGQAWHAMGEGFDGPAYGLGIFNGQLYAGGEFTASGNTALGRIARWNGSVWEHPGFEFEHTNASVRPFIHTLRPIGDSLYISGGFNRIKLNSGVTLIGSGVVALNSSLQINTLGGGAPNKEIEAIIPYNGGVLFGGGTTTSSGYLGFWNPATSSIETLSDEHSPMVYPNPATDFLEIGGLENHRYALISILDAHGKICFQTAIEPDLDRINLPKLPNGLYFVQFSGSKTTSPFQEKLLILQD